MHRRKVLIGTAAVFVLGAAGMQLHREAVLPLLEPQRAAGRAVAARGLAGQGFGAHRGAARGDPRQGPGRRHLRHLRRQRLAALLPVARAEPVPRQFRAAGGAHQGPAGARAGSRQAAPRARERLPRRARPRHARAARPAGQLPDPVPRHRRGPGAAEEDRRPGVRESARPSGDARSQRRLGRQGARHAHRGRPGPRARARRHLRRRLALDCRHRERRADRPVPRGRPPGRRRPARPGRRPRLARHPRRAAGEHRLGQDRAARAGRAHLRDDGRADPLAPLARDRPHRAGRHHRQRAGARRDDGDRSRPSPRSAPRCRPATASTPAAPTRRTSRRSSRSPPACRSPSPSSSAC